MTKHASRRLAIVTGGSKGLGLALCEQLLSRDYRVIEFSRTAPHPYSVQVDLSLPLESQRTVAAAIAPFAVGSLEHLLVVNNAGTLSPIGPSSTKSPNALAANLNVNLTSGILYLAAVISRFQAAECPKVIVNISSGAAAKGYAGWSLYCAAKAGMENFIRALAAEQRQLPWPFVAINVDPGVIDTEMQAHIRTASPSDFPDVQRFTRRKNEGALATPRDTAQQVLRIVLSGGIESGGRYDVAAFKL